MMQQTLLTGIGGGPEADNVLQQLVAGVPVSRMGSSSNSRKSTGPAGKSSAVSKGRRSKAAGAVAFDVEFGSIFVDNGAGTATDADHHDSDRDMHEQGSQSLQQQQQHSGTASDLVAAASSSMVGRRRRLSSRR